MYKHRINNTHNSGGAKDVIEASPLALIAVGTSRAVLSPCVTRQIAHTATLYLLQGGTIGSVIKVSSNENTGIRRHSMQRVERLA